MKRLLLYNLFLNNTNLCYLSQIKIFDPQKMTNLFTITPIENVDKTNKCKSYKKTKKLA